MWLVNRKSTGCLDKMFQIVKVELIYSQYEKQEIDRLKPEHNLSRYYISSLF